MWLCGYVESTPHLHRVSSVCVCVCVSGVTVGVSAGDQGDRTRVRLPGLVAQYPPPVCQTSEGLALNTLAEITHSHLMVLPRSVFRQVLCTLFLLHIC